MDNLTCFLLFLIVLFGMRSLAAKQTHRGLSANPRNVPNSTGDNDPQVGSNK